MTQYRKKPVVIDAAQWFSNGHCPVWAQHAVTEHGTHFTVSTLEGAMRGDPRDWIIKGVKGEIYPCKPEIFAATYEPAGQPAASEAGAVPFAVDAHTLIPRLQSLLDRMCNDTRTAAMFEADGDTLRDAIRLLREIKRYTPPAPVEAGSVPKPYAYEFAKSNGDGTYSVVIERSDLEQVGLRKYEYAAPKNALKEYAVKPLYDHPASVEAGAVPERNVQTIKMMGSEDKITVYRSLGYDEQRIVWNAAPPAESAQPADVALPAWWDAFITNVCEIPDRNSPDDEPDAMIATRDELEACALNAIESQPTAATADAQHPSYDADCCQGHNEQDKCKCAKADAQGDERAEEDRIDALRLKAFRTNDPDDRRNYFEATSKWFQDRDYRALSRQPSAAASVGDAATAGKLREPKNGDGWRVEWWNESARMLLPDDKRLDSFQSYKNGTLVFTIKDARAALAAAKPERGVDQTDQNRPEGRANAGDGVLTKAKQDAPTDAEIIALARETQSADPGRDGYILPITFARAQRAAAQEKPE